jgi:hypothetical protein
MTFSSQLLTLADYLVGEFDNREQSLAEPAWFVHLRLWHIKIPLFTEDSLTLFAEQANVLKLDRPYRQRIIRFIPTSDPYAPVKVQYYMPKEPDALRGGGRNLDLLNLLTEEQIDFLPGCILTVTQEKLLNNSYKFSATAPPESRCNFDYAGSTVQVSLGFEATETEFLSYDKGIDSTTGKATWGAILGPYRYTKLC